jgi:DNA polymerase-3 subunit alpha
LLAGLVVGVRSKFTARGKMAFIQIDDGTSALEVSVFNELLEAERARSGRRGADHRRPRAA